MKIKVKIEGEVDILSIPSRMLQWKLTPETFRFSDFLSIPSRMLQKLGYLTHRVALTFQFLLGCFLKLHIHTMKE